MQLQKTNVLNSQRLRPSGSTVKIQLVKHKSQDFQQQPNMFRYFKTHNYPSTISVGDIATSEYCLNLPKKVSSTTHESRPLQGLSGPLTGKSTESLDETSAIQEKREPSFMIRHNLQSFMKPKPSSKTPKAKISSVFQRLSKTQRNPSNYGLLSGS